MRLNENFDRLQNNYLFTDIAKRVNAFKEANPAADIIRLGIGDVTRPLSAPVLAAMRRAVDEMGETATFRGYGPEGGYPFSREAVRDYYARKGVALETAEIFVSDGAKSDIGNLLEIFSADNTVLIPDPVYPAYLDANLMAGRKVVYAEGNRENGFLPAPDDMVEADIIYLCSPNNPTGSAYSAAGLKAWVNYAQQCGAVILYDAAYECFIEEAGVPHSIYEIDGAKEVAIEVCSLSKTAGFNGTRCGYTVVPMDLLGQKGKLNGMWQRRQGAKYNETAYIIQRGAEAALSPEGQKACFENVAYYKKNAAVIAAAVEAAGLWYTGGKNSPYIWLACPSGLDSWAFFDLLLEKANVVGTPGAGFGKAGEGFFRLTGFGDAEKTKEAAQRLLDVLR